MTLYDFTLLEDREKIRLLYDHGVYIGKRKTRGTSVALYQLEGFYAEIFYHTYRRHIKQISSFAGTAGLDPYLTEINVEHLV
jgi:hypothetical protein